MTSQLFTGDKLDALLDDLTDLAQTEPHSGAFFQSMLNAAVGATHAVAGAIWSVVEVNYRLEKELGLVQLGIGTDDQLQAIHEEALACASQPPSQEGSSSVVKRSYEGKAYRFFGCKDQNAAYLVIELVHDANSIAAIDESSVARLMAALSEIAKDFRNSQLLERLRKEDSLWADFKETLPKLHASIQLEETSYRIANEGRTFLHCDRLSVARVDRGKISILAVSGVSSIESRSKQVRALESFVGVISRMGESFRYPSNTTEGPEVSEVLQAYLDEARTEQVWILLMRDRMPATETRGSDVRPICGALVIEIFDSKETPLFVERGELLLEHASIAFANAIAYSQMPLRRLGESLQGYAALYRRVYAKLILGFVATLIALGLALTVPSELNIEARGTIQPVALRHLYAPASGEVVNIQIAHQSEVQSGSLLMEIRSRELELRKEELLTLHASAQEKLRAIEVSRLQNRKINPLESISIGELSANESELREVVASQKEQLSVLNAMLASLQLKSPIDGRVISWDQTETLDHRPVQIGQKLISIAALEGDGRLQLRVLDEDIRHVVNAQKKIAEDLSVTFSLASDPGVKRTARVTQIGTTVESLTDQGPTLRLDALVDAREMGNVRPGATATARIHCGKTCIGYVWTRRLWDFLYYRIF